MAAKYDKISFKLLELIIKLGLLCAQVIGIWPYRYDRSSKSFHSSKLLSCYTAVIMPFTFFAYIFAIKNIKINDDNRAHIPSSTARLTTVFLSLAIITGYSISSVYLTTNYSTIIKWVKKSKEIIRKIHHLREGYVLLPFLRPVLHFILKVLLINGLLIYATIGILLNLISDLTAMKPWLIAFYMLPSVSLTIICDIFYGSMLTTTYYYRLLNHHFKTIVSELSSNLLETSRNASSYIFNENSEHLIDEIDQLAILHLGMTTCTTFMSRVFGVHLMCFMTCELFVFISKLFIIFIIIEFEWRRHLTVQFNYSILWYNTVVFVVPLWSMCLLSHSSYTTMKESEKAADILMPISVTSSTDSRFRQSVDSFSVQLVNNKLKLTVCGLYNMDHTVIYSMIASAVSYTFILIQFELSDDYHHNLLQTE